MDNLHTTIKFYEVKASLLYKSNQKLRELARWPLAYTCVLFSRYVCTAEVILYQERWNFIGSCYSLLTSFHASYILLFIDCIQVNTSVFNKLLSTAYSDSNTFCGDNRGSKITVLWREG